MKNFVDVLAALDIVSKENSTNEKIVLLKEFCKSELFTKVCVFALESHRNYHLTKLPKVPINEVFADQDELFRQLDKLSNSTGASNTNKNTLAFVAAANQHSFEVINRIIAKDLKCGVSAKTINRACPGLIKEWPYMRCQSFTEKNLKRIQYPAQAEEKCDGTHIDVVVKGGKVSFISRKGRPMNFHGVLDEFFDHIKDDIVFIGEGLVSDKFSTILPRKIGNGIINKAIKGTITEEEAETVCLTLWDAVPYEDFVNGYCRFTQKQRFEKLVKEFPIQFDKVVEVVNYRIVENEQQAMNFYKFVRKFGGEGAIVKNLKGVFKNHTSPDQVKVKNVIDFDLLVTGWKYGETGTKYEKCLGAIICESSCRKLKVSVGSGFSDQNRKDFCNDKIIGSIATIICESIITSKNKETSSLFLPRFDCFREDIETAQTLKDMIER